MPEEDEKAEQEIIDEVEKTMNHYESQAGVQVDPSEQEKDDEEFKDMMDQKEEIPEKLADQQEEEKESDQN